MAVSEFRDIRYAVAPTGAARFAAPSSVDGESGGGGQGAAAPQPNGTSRWTSARLSGRAGSVVRIT